MLRPFQERKIAEYSFTAPRNTFVSFPRKHPGILGTGIEAGMRFGRSRYRFRRKRSGMLVRIGVLGPRQGKLSASKKTTSYMCAIRWVA